MRFFTAEQRTLEELLINTITYIIPSYQRLYSWEAKGKSDKDNQVNVMWEDLIEHFESDERQPYFMGSMVFIEPSDSTYEVVDGQQRLMTLTLLFVAIKCMFQELKDIDIEPANRKGIKFFIQNGAIEQLDNFLFNKTWEGLLLKEKKVKIERLAGFDYDAVLKTSMECETIRQINLVNAFPEQVQTVHRYFENRNYLKENVRDYFSENGKVTQKKLQLLNQFITFLQKKVTIIRIICLNLDIAYQIFEILNNRGLPLSNKDLFRNFIIKEMQNSGIQQAEKKWLHLDSYHFSPQFLSRYVESQKATKQHTAAFNDVKAFYKQHFEDSLNKQKVELFCEDLEDNLKHYTNIKLLDFDNVAIKHRIDFLKNSGNASSIINLLLALFRNTSTEQQHIIFLKELELFTLYQLLAPSKRFATSTIFEAIQFLNSTHFDKALASIRLSNSEKTDLKDRLVNHDIQNNNWARLILARYFWAKEIDNPKDVVEVELFYKVATLEHIIPQTPEANTNWTKDFSKDFRNQYTYKLGNMTLLTQPMNSQAKNYDFSKKKQTYRKTKLPMTHSISKLNSINENYIEKRHEEITQCLIEHFEL